MFGLALTVALTTAAVARALDCTHYAASENPGTGEALGAPGNPGTLAQPFTIDAFFRDDGAGMPAQPGMTLCLLDGTYRGDESTISIHRIHGQEGAPITVAALHDGAVLIDGEETRKPVSVKASSWIVLEGFDAANGAGSVVSIGPQENDLRSEPSHHVEVRRVVAWNANPRFADDDADGVMNANDNCAHLANPPVQTSEGLIQPNDDRDQEDLLGQAFVIGNLCDCDFDQDNVCGSLDNDLLLDDLCWGQQTLTEPGLDCPARIAARGLSDFSGAATDMNSDGTHDDRIEYAAAFAANGGAPGPGQIDDIGNSHVVEVVGADDILLEDVAAFGTGRKIIQVYKSVNVTVRRVWARWEGNGARNDRAVSCAYRSYGSRCENLLVTANSNQTIGPGPGVGMLVGTDWWYGDVTDAYYAPGGDPQYVDLVQTGSLAYVKDAMSCAAAADHSPSTVPCIGKGFFAEGGKSRGKTYTDGVVYINDTRPLAERPIPWVLQSVECPDGTSGGEATCDPELLISNMTSWGARGGSIDRDWQTDRIVVNDDLVPDPPFESVFAADPATGAGGQLCQRADGSGRSLWPWPMQDRILAATSQQTAYSVPPSLAFHRAGWAPDPVDVHASIEQMFGTIPLQCWDTDGDGVSDYSDNCAEVPNGPYGGACASQEDGDMDGFGNACDTDVNNDGATSAADVWLVQAAVDETSTDPVYDFNCDGGTGVDDLIRVRGDSQSQRVPGPSGLSCAGTIPCLQPDDADADGVLDVWDNCKFVPNGPLANTDSCDSQLDGDQDGYGNPCDTDVNNDGATSYADVWLVQAAVDETSTDPAYDFNCDGGTGVDDLIQVQGDSESQTVPGPSGLPCAGTTPCEDSDADGVLDAQDNCVDLPNGPLASTGSCDWQLDGDQDGYGNPCDTDVNNDGATSYADVSLLRAAVDETSTDPVYDFNCDGGTGVDDLIWVQGDSQSQTVPGPSGLSCAGTIPCP